MEIKKELKILIWIIVIFSAVFFMPLGNERFMTAIHATLDLSKWYAQEHVITCLLPAFFIAGVIAVFINQILANKRMELENDLRDEKAIQTVRKA